MKIKSVRIENFRSFADATISFGDYVCLVGPNGAGKSTILSALNVFFRETETHSTNLGVLFEEDFHRKNTSAPIRITVTFTDLSPDAKNDLAHYCRHGELTVSAVARFDPDNRRAEVKQYGQRMAIKSFAPFFEARDDNAPVSQLKLIYAKLQKAVPDLPGAATKPAMENALRTYEEEHPDECELLESNSQFYGFSRGVNQLGKHVQWVYVPAIKDPSTEQVEARNSALGKLLARTVRAKTSFDEAVKELRGDLQRKYQEVLDTHQSALTEISNSLQNRLTEWAHPDAKLRLEWRQDLDKSVRVEEPVAHIRAGEGGFEGELSRFGHGLQRSYVLALLQELAGADTSGAPTLILGCEEPELYQHPPQARHLAGVLRRLCEGNCQVTLSTHSPIFVSGYGFEDIRTVRKESSSSASSVTFTTFEAIATHLETVTGAKTIRPAGTLARVHQALQPALNEMFFTKRLILVEGLEDQAYLLTYLDLLGILEDYRKMGWHIVPVGGKSNLLRPLVLAKRLELPTYVVFDADATDDRQRGQHEKENRELLLTLNATDVDPWPDETVLGAGFTMWRSNIGEVVEDDIGQQVWTSYRDKATEEYGYAGGLKKNALHIATSLTLAWEGGHRSADLEAVCHRIIES